MTLAPETRVLLTDALRPPTGFGLDIAVGTTYSLDLMSMLLAPLSFALHDRVNATDTENADPVRLLEAVRRYADKTTVFCQAGGIGVPAAYRSILTFVEESVVEVVAPTEGALFHPKVWALRFVSESGALTHRIVISSRNLTQDRSWDTALVLDEDPAGTIDAEPMSNFVKALPGLALRDVDDKRVADARDLARSLSKVKLIAPAPFTGGELHPIGIDGKRVWPFPTTATRLLAISPFLTKGALSELAGMASKRTLVSRMESLELVGGDALRGWDVNVLQRLAEVGAGEDVGGADRVTSELVGAYDGLHAKTFVLDVTGNESLVVTGSANLTSRRWGNNVEFDAVLRGPTRECGVLRVLEGAKDAPGLIRVLEEAAIDHSEGIDNPQIETSYAIEDFHRTLAEKGVVLDISRSDGESVVATLNIQLPTNVVGQTRVWLASLNSGGHAVELVDGVEWVIAASNVTPFVAFETVAGTGDAQVTRRCVLKAALTGDVADRHKNALGLVLESRHDVLRYLIFLLGEPAYDALVAELAGATDGGGWGEVNTGESIDVALFEPLIRATGRDDGSLARMATAIEEMRKVPSVSGMIPDGFEELWDTVWAVHQESRR